VKISIIDLIDFLFRVTHNDNDLLFFEMVSKLRKLEQQSMNYPNIPRSVKISEM